MRMRGGLAMATRQSIEDCLNRCESAILNAQEQYDLANRQEHHYDVEFGEALGQLEMTVKELDKLSDSSNAQQREQLYRARLKVQQLQNNMILTDHGRP